MSYQLNFSELVNYDLGQEGITITTRLSLGREFVEVLTKIDTGATYCIFTRSLGEKIGLDIESGTKQLMSTATGLFLTYRHDVTLTVCSFDFDVNVCFAADEAFSRNVLGRHGFLDRIRLAIIDNDGKLYLSHYDEE